MLGPDWEAREESPVSAYRLMKFATNIYTLNGKSIKILDINFGRVWCRRVVIVVDFSFERN